MKTEFFKTTFKFSASLIFAGLLALGATQVQAQSQSKSRSRAQLQQTQLATSAAQDCLRRQLLSLFSEVSKVGAGQPCDSLDLRWADLLFS